MRVAACLLLLLCAGCAPAAPAASGLFVLGWGVPSANGWQLVGQVRLNDAPWEGARLSVWPLGAPAPVVEATTDAAGRFRLTLEVPAGTPLRLEARRGEQRLAAFAVAPVAPSPARWQLQQVPPEVLIDAASTLALLILAPRLEAITQLMTSRGGGTVGAALGPLTRAYSEASAAAGLTLQALAANPAQQAEVVGALAAWEPTAGLGGFPAEMLNMVTAPSTPLAQAIAQVARSLDEALSAAAGSEPLNLPPALLAPLTIGQITLPAASPNPPPTAPNQNPAPAPGLPPSNGAAGGGGAGGGGGSSPSSNSALGPSVQLGLARGVPSRAGSTPNGTTWNAHTAPPTRAASDTHTLTPQISFGVPTRLDSDTQAVGLPAPGGLPAPAPAASDTWQFTPGVPAPAPSPSTQPITLGR